MEPIYWQLRIIFSISISYLIIYWFLTRTKKLKWINRINRIGLIVPLIWTIWTLYWGWYNKPLTYIQLIFTWGTYLLSWVFFNQRKKIHELTELTNTLKNYPKINPKEIRKKYNKDKQIIIQIEGKAHKKELIDSINNSKEDLIILSGWISDYVIMKNEEFLPSLISALKKGVNVYLGYGYETSGKHESRYATKALKEFESLEDKYSNLKIKVFATHKKLIIKDDEYIICGSFNWLSNNSVNNEEASLKIKDLDTVISIKKDYLNDFENDLDVSI